MLILKLGDAVHWNIPAPGPPPGNRGGHCLSDYCDTIGMGQVVNYVDKTVAVARDDGTVIFIKADKVFAVNGYHLKTGASV